jgi:small conductance mechanosensitive channel
MTIRRVDVYLGTAYYGGIDKAIDVAMRFIKERPLVLNEPSPAVVVTELGDSWRVQRQNDLSPAQ